MVPYSPGVGVVKPIPYNLGYLGYLGYLPPCSLWCLIPPAVWGILRLTRVGLVGPHWCSMAGTGGTPVQVATPLAVRPRRTGNHAADCETKTDR